MNDQNSTPETQTVDVSPDAAKASHAAIGKERRTRSFVLGGLAALICLALGIYRLCTTGVGDGIMSFAWLLLAPFAYTFVSCCVLGNNFILEMVLTVWTWGFVRFPGLIFTLNLEGIVWLITVKLIFWLIGFLIGAMFFLLAIGLGMLFSLFVYPYALRKNLQRPEEFEV